MKKGRDNRNSRDGAEQDAIDLLDDPAVRAEFFRRAAWIYRAELAAAIADVDARYEAIKAGTYGRTYASKLPQSTSLAPLAPPRPFVFSTGIEEKKARAKIEAAIKAPAPKQKPRRRPQATRKPGRPSLGILSPMMLKYLRHAAGGDNLEQIAREYGTTANAVCMALGLAAKRLCVAGRGRARYQAAATVAAERGLL